VFMIYLSMFKKLNVKNVVLPIIRLTALAADWHTRKFFRD
jgi:hypothetical protein